jgi:hypothetical protein
MRLSAFVFALVFLSACNLNNQPGLPPTAAPSETQTPTQTGTIPPTLTILPAVGSTRTPFGSNPPTIQALGTIGVFPTPATGEQAVISSPTNGASVSGSPLYLSGIAYNLTEDRFTLQVFDANGQALTNGQIITLSNPNHISEVPWSASVLLGRYTGAAQIRVSARTASGPVAVIGMVDVTITAGGAQSQPASGAFVGSITSPAEGSSVSGDPITVTGTAGGIPDNQFILILFDGSGTTLNSQLITLTGAERNAVPWSASMGTSGYRGQIEIRAVATGNITIASVHVTLQ